MFKSEPKTILQFLATHFDLLRQLFDIQTKGEVILKSQVSDALKEFGSDVEQQLFDHKLLVQQNDDYVINEPYFVLFEFILQQFKPLLPEEIEKFGQSIRALFLNIKDGLKKDRNLLLDRIEALSSEIKKFRNAVTNNTISLLNESRELKANTQKIEYQEKIQKARYLIENYIVPLNTILDVNHTQSIYNELVAVSRFSNSRRFDYSDESIRRQFEKQYDLLRQVLHDIGRQSMVLSNELLPLLDRIRTASEYLQGFHRYLSNMNCYKEIKPPKLLHITRDTLYSPFINENTEEYFEQFKNEEDVFIEEETWDIEPWIFDENEYKSRLGSALPIADFFTWCKEALENDKKDFDIDSYFMVASLVFEEEYEVEQDKVDRNITLKTKQGVFIMPKLKISKKEHVSE
ncbi:hypothetical protein L0P88_13495 [Muricauda sp. SCSIO 64092]|uniref:hypothetical protein n=1 Tax=Allomuricauda sp. SCSIO 64092 TaxID=2908842 RepID=UPI001FF248A7|nr:hypothetical protein [Muricauda sp. SCSIO 64092]UOY04965.1 hypothetical protein L0P88_13495 [Muricauda sp. SCSIO 64092]